MKKRLLWSDGLYLGLLILTLYFCVLNISPYTRAIAQLSFPIRGILTGGGVISLPLLGDVLTWLVAALLWAGIQLIEVLPLLIKEDERFLELLIRTGTNQRFSIEKTDDPVLTGLKRVYNAMPLRLIKNLYRAQVFTYVIDFMVVVTVYPPASSLQVFLKSLVLGNFTAIDWLNLALASITLFAVEILLLGLIYAWRLNHLYKLSRGMG
jgi:hypothetical protein